MTFKFKETCPQRGLWCSFRLVDEHGNFQPYAGLDYVLHDRMGIEYAGTLDSDGFGYLKEFHCGPLILDLSMPYQGAVDPWYDTLQQRNSFPLPLTALQVAAEQSPRGPRQNGTTYLAQQRAERENALFFRVEARDFARPGEAAHLPEADPTLAPRPSAFLKDACTHANTQPGVALVPNTHQVLEVKALRAYSPLLSHDKAFCALNAYHLGLMAVLSYGPFHTLRKYDETPTPPPYRNPGCIGAVLQTQLGHCERPTRFESAGPYHLLLEEVPYSKRLEVVPYDPVRYAEEAKAGWDYLEKVHFLLDESDTEAFITHNDKILLISIRGTAGLADALRDADARQVPYLPDEGGHGQAHRGFYGAFEVARRFVERYMKAFYTDQTIMVCGHSLGGAIALLLAEWLRTRYSENIQLYTIGAPRAGDQAFVRAAAGLTHHRIVNHNDPVPGVPSTWMDAEWKMAASGTAMLVASVGSPWLGIVLLLGGLINLRGDDYEHHGEQRHLIPRKPDAKGHSSLLWQPGCEAIEQKTCAEFAAEIELNGDMPRRSAFLMQALSAAEHSSDGGYSRGALATLLRWHVSVRDRGGQLFTDDERKQLNKHIEPLLKGTQTPVKLSYIRFRHNLRMRGHYRFNRRPETELRAMFHDSQKQLEAVAGEQHKKLTRAQKRLRAQGERPLAWEDVFGDLPQTEHTLALINAWLDYPDIKAAAKLAKLTTPDNERQALA